jgi:hypothetical protein
LDDARAIAQVQKNHAAMIPTAIDPPKEVNCFSNLGAR